jgi:rubrerythrin
MAGKIATLASMEYCSQLQEQQTQFEARLAGNEQQLVAQLQELREQLTAAAAAHSSSAQQQLEQRLGQLLQQQEQQLQQQSAAAGELAASLRGGLHYYACGLCCYTWRQVANQCNCMCAIY